MRVVAETGLVADSSRSIAIVKLRFHEYSSIFLTFIYIRWRPQMAVTRNHFGTVEALLNAGARVNQPRSDSGATPLVLSAMNQNGSEITKALLVSRDSSRVRHLLLLILDINFYYHVDQYFMIF